MKRLSNMRSILWLLVAALPLAAQSDSASVTGPVLGVVFDAVAGQIRPLTGVPASAVLGDPFEVNGLSTAVALGGLGISIGVDGNSGTSLLISASGAVPLPGVKSGATRIAVSPLGRSAAFYFADSDTVQIVTGLPARPRVIRELASGGKPSAMAVSDDGGVLLVASAQDGGESVSVDDGDPGLRLLWRASHVVAMEFFPDSHNALFAESGANAVWLIQTASGSQQVLPLTDERDGIADVKGLAGSADLSTIFIATHSGRVAIRNAASGEQTVVECPCEPGSLSRLRGKAVFRLNGIGDGPVWLLDASGDQPRILFVAAAARGEQ